MYRSNPFCSTKTPGLNMWKHLWTRKRENPKTRKREESTCGRENSENAKTAKTAKTRKPRKRGKRENAKTAKTRKRENGENAKTAKTRKPRKRGKRENGENPENVKTAKTTKTRKRPKVFLFSGFQFLVFWFSRFSRFSGFSFSGFLVPLAASFWPGRVFYVLRHILCIDIYIYNIYIQRFFEFSNTATHSDLSKHRYYAFSFFDAMSRCFQATGWASIIWFWLVSSCSPSIYEFLMKVPFVSLCNACFLSV